MPKKLPRISLITPTYNQSNFIEATILSVLNQDYPNLEYIIMDGGSTDRTVSILKKYEDKIKWISKKDRGQSDALNRGLKQITGDIVGFLNSDDLLEENSLTTIAKYFQENRNIHWVTGKCNIIDENSNKVRSFIREYKNFFLKYIRNYKILHILNFIAQPSTFWRREIIKDIGLFNEAYHYSMDYEYWIRISKKYTLGFIDRNISSFRVHPKSKSTQNLSKQLKESYNIASLSTRSQVLLNLHKLHDILILFCYRYIFQLNE